MSYIFEDTLTYNVVKRIIFREKLIDIFLSKEKKIAFTKKGLEKKGYPPPKHVVKRQVCNSELNIKEPKEMHFKIEEKIEIKL